ncbi:hypothetical protein AC578_6500 [Pseudocercospora eumusae]|uniref:Uncharacterized protein n=1 Tax=Pseudocercospora eumusae TaxID=321146 RepID=A0A139HHT9_9PEZI|nr:hypothetical protein AC578_6500 [Pseudocercospora eumusae]
MLILGASSQSSIYPSPTFKHVVWPVCGEDEDREANISQLSQSEIPARPLPHSDGGHVSFPQPSRLISSHTGKIRVFWQQELLRLESNSCGMHEICPEAAMRSWPHGFNIELCLQEAGRAMTQDDELCLQPSTAVSFASGTIQKYGQRERVLRSHFTNLSWYGIPSALFQVQ